MRYGVSSLKIIFVYFVAKLFSSRHKVTKTLRKINKIKSFVSLWQIFLDSGLSALLRLPGERACPS
jgi:hypothetical protein